MASGRRNTQNRFSKATSNIIANPNVKEFKEVKEEVKSLDNSEIKSEAKISLNEAVSIKQKGIEEVEVTDENMLISTLSEKNTESVVKQENNLDFVFITKKPKKTGRPRTLYIKDDDYSKLEFIAEKYNKSISEVLRIIINYFFSIDNQ